MHNDNYGSYNPQILDFTLHFWDSDNKWTHQEFPLKELIQHRDSFPHQNKKEINAMLNKIQDAISTLTDLNCMAITMDLVDDITGGENF